jgi:hypothetical protein
MESSMIHPDLPPPMNPCFSAEFRSSRKSCQISASVPAVLCKRTPHFRENFMCSLFSVWLNDFNDSVFYFSAPPRLGVKLLHPPPVLLLVAARLRVTPVPRFIESPLSNLECIGTMNLIDSSRLTGQRWTIHPLLGGEDRGEGERSTIVRGSWIKGGRY